MNIVDIQNKLKHHNTVFAYGEETYFLSFIEKSFIKNLGVQASDKIDIKQGSETTYKEIQVFLTSLSLMGGKNVLIIKGTPKKIDTDLSFLNAVPLDSYILFVIESETLPTEFDKISGLKLEAKPMQKWGDGHRKWMLDYFNIHNVKVTEDIITYVINNIGKDSLWNLANEMDKLIFMSDKSGNIPTQYIKNIINTEISNDISLILDALLIKNTTKAIQLTNSIYSKTGSYLPIIVFFQLNIERAILLQLMQKRSAPIEDISKKLRLSQFLVEKEQKRMTRYPITKLKFWYNCFSELERLVRNDSQLVNLKMQNIILDIANTHLSWI